MRRRAAIALAVLCLAIIGFGLLAKAGQWVAAGLGPTPPDTPWAAGVLAMLLLGIPAVVAARLVARRSAVGRRLGLLVSVVTVPGMALVLIAIHSRSTDASLEALLVRAAPWIGFMLLAALTVALLLSTRDSFAERFEEPGQ
jgi:hypothetical protein